MNKKDCEHIGYILSIAKTREELYHELFAMDKRIEFEFIAYEEVHDRHENVDKRANEIMLKRNKDVPGVDHHGWATIKQELLKYSYSEALDEARKEVYGEDYHPSLFK